MPSVQNISYNSSRVQRAYRINSIEGLRLQNRIQLLEKEKLHTQRLNNQDIRLISLTLDYIQTHSGHSAEGLPPDGAKVVEKVVPEYDDGPTFLYGERIVSRKKRRTLRPQSALDKSSSRLNSLNSESSSTISTIGITARPQSSPIRRATFVTQLKDRDDDSVFGSASESSRSSAGTPTQRFKPAWTEEPMPDVTKVLLRAASEHNKRDSIFARSHDIKSLSGSSALKSLTRNMRISSTSGLDNSAQMKAAHSRPASEEPVRATRITDILNKGPKATMSANAWKSHLNCSQSGPQNASTQRQYVMETKKAVNAKRTKIIDRKVKKFVSESSHI
ncbi:uncharacterized protein LOC128239014 [Mya arenaria]|uniref:uncharacterized protein LOC128239014 n=1 Tax=Mya arenaria TaxID=6604 RepID=UPI0022E5191D|nr:uncharacterized protein LOC128239014 [Mya arenaria]XP_052811384.1 uncharacterized protein LOC128239014 [Mya arenaria]XP_052811385.1 uncharacterized protein LOC128239014 [Mya arenaria]